MAARLAAEWNDVQVDLVDLSQMPGTSAEVVTLIGSLEHVMAPREILEHAHRILVPNGLLFVYTPVWGVYDTIATLAARVSRNRFTKLADWRVNKTHLQIFTRSTLLELLRKTGFETLAFETVCEYHVPVRSYLSAMGLAHPRLQSAAARAFQFLIDHKLFFQNNMHVLATKKAP